MTVANLAKKAAQASPALPRLRPKKAQRKRWEVLELAERWTFVGRNRRKVWLWLALERARRRLMAWVLGTRGTTTCHHLWAALPARYHRHCWYYPDEWPAYAAVLPLHAPRRDKAGQPKVVEALTCSLRQRCGVLVRKACSFSKSLSMHQARIKIVIDQHNASITLP